jgi:hypothetical protein
MVTATTLMSYVCVDVLPHLVDEDHGFVFLRSRNPTTKERYPVYSLLESVEVAWREHEGCGMVVHECYHPYNW